MCWASFCIFILYSLFEHNQESWIFAGCCACACYSGLQQQRWHWQAVTAASKNKFRFNKSPFGSAIASSPRDRQTHAGQVAEVRGRRGRGAESWIYVNVALNRKQSSREFTPLLQSLLCVCVCACRDQWQHRTNGDLADCNFTVFIGIWGNERWDNKHRHLSFASIVTCGRP